MKNYFFCLNLHSQHQHTRHVVYLSTTVETNVKVVTRQYRPESRSITGKYEIPAKTWMFFVNQHAKNNSSQKIISETGNQL